MFFYRKIWWTRFLHTIFAGMKKLGIYFFLRFCVMKKYFLVVAIVLLEVFNVYARRVQFICLHFISNSITSEETDYIGKKSRSLTEIIVQIDNVDNQLQLIFEPFYKGQAVYNITDEYGNCFANGSVDSEITNVEYINIDISSADYYVITLMVEDGSTYEGYIQLE